MKFIFIIIIGYCAVFSVSRCNNGVHGIDGKRPFFTLTKADYYDSTLDSMGIIGHFGIDSVSKIVRGKKYWEFRNSRYGSFNLAGMLRFQQDTVFILTPVKNSYDSGTCEEQVLFIFDPSAVGKRWAVDYSCKSSIIRGDSVLLYTFYFDDDTGDTLYDFHLKSYFVQKGREGFVHLPEYYTILTASRNLGLIRLTFLSRYGRTSLGIYPEFGRMDTNHLTPNYPSGY